MNEDYKTELVTGLRKIYGNHLLNIILYGSVAKGTATKDSDIDIAIIIDHTEDKSQKDKLLDFAVELDLKYDRVFSILDIDIELFSKWENVLPFYKNVKKDGISLWKAA